jgi:hypothetical protein
MTGVVRLVGITSHSHGGGKELCLAKQLTYLCNGIMEPELERAESQEPNSLLELEPKF